MFFKLLALFIVSTAILSSGPILNRIDIDSDQIGPFYKGQQVSTSVNISFYINTNFNATFRAFVLLPDGYGYFFYASSSFYATPGLVKTFTFPFPTEHLSTENYLDISYRVYSSDDNNHYIRQQVDFSIKLPVSKTININDLENKVYESDYTSLTIDNNIVSYNTEKFDFSYIGEDISENNYLYIDFRKIKFKYEGTNKLVSGDVSVKFIDFYNNFPNLYKNSIYTVVDLTIKYDTKAQLYYLALADNYYYNTLTHDMSMYNGVNMRKTSLFFLPKDKHDDLEGTIFNFSISACGEEQNNYMFFLPYYYGTKLIGGCNTSDYCIVGELYD